VLIQIIAAANIASANTHGRCDCSPINYYWEYDFNLTCDDSRYTMGEGSGIKSYSCDTEPRDLRPFKVIGLTWRELRQNGDRLNEGESFGFDYYDTDLFNSTSLTKIEPSVYTYGYELEVIAIDETETIEIFQNITVIFSAECDIPVFNPADRMGWFRFNDELSEPARDSTCVHEHDGPTMAPTGSSLTSAAPTCIVEKAGKKGHNARASSSYGRRGKGGKGGKGSYDELNPASSKSPGKGGKGGKGGSGYGSSKSPKSKSAKSSKMPKATGCQKKSKKSSNIQSPKSSKAPKAPKAGKSIKSEKSSKSSKKGKGHIDDYHHPAKHSKKQSKSSRTGKGGKGKGHATDGVKAYE